MLKPTRFLFPFTFLYGLATLTSQAVMSISVALLIAAMVWSLIQSRGVDLKSAILEGDPWVRRLWILTVVFAGTVWGGAFLQLLWRAQVLDRTAELSNFQSLFKLIYLFLPFFLWWGLVGQAQAPAQSALAGKWLGDSKRIFDALKKGWLIAFSVAAVVGVQQYWTGWPRVQPIPGNPGHFHATLLMGHHLSVASILIFPFFVFLDSGQELFQGRRWARWLWALISILGLLTLFFTFSRTLWLALFVGAAVYLHRKVSWKLWLAGVGASGVLALVVSQLPIISQRLHDPLGVSDRTRLWQANWALFLQSPLFGVGLRKNSELAGYWLQDQLHTAHVFSGHAHNLYLDLLSGTGIFGLISWLAWAAVVTHLFWRLSYRRNRPGYLAAWVVFLLNGMTQVNFWEGKVMHQVVWVLFLAYFEWKSGAEA
jgi:hypothetical protein